MTGKKDQNESNTDTIHKYEYVKIHGEKEMLEKVVMPHPNGDVTPEQRCHIPMIMPHTNNVAKPQQQLHIPHTRDNATHTHLPHSTHPTIHLLLHWWCQYQCFFTVPN
jgi:hypothetical protein